MAIKKRVSDCVVAGRRMEKIMDERLKQKKIEDAFTEEEILEKKIGDINNQIKNCEYDLKGMFKGHEGMINKLKLLNEQKDKLIALQTK